MEQPEIKVNHIETKSVMTKSNTPLGGYSVNPYVGCPHACKYCYASFMKRFTGHTEPWHQRPEKICRSEDCDRHGHGRL